MRAATPNPLRSFRNLFGLMPRNIAKMHFRMLGLLAFFLSEICLGQSSLTDAEVTAAIDRALSGKRHAIGLTLNDVQTNLLSGLVCETCRTSGYTIFVYTPESWIELKAVQARREMLPFGAEDVSPEMRLQYIHILASPSKPEYLNASGIGMASSVHRIVLSSTDRSDVIQPLSESHAGVESNSALRSFSQASVGAVFSMKDVEPLRAEDPGGEFFIVVVGDNQNKYFKVKGKFFKQLFGRDRQYTDIKPTPPRPGGGKQTSTGNTSLATRPSSKEPQPDMTELGSADEPSGSLPAPHPILPALTKTDLPAPTEVPSAGRTTTPDAATAAIHLRASGNDKSGKTAAGELDTYQYGSAVTASWWNIRPAGGVSQSADMSQANASAGMGVSKTTDEGSIGAWSDEKPRIKHDGVKIDRLRPNGPADEVGVQVGDYILALGGLYVFTVEELAENVHRCRLGDRVSLRYRRRSTIYDTFIVMGSQRVLDGQAVLKATQ
jgi:hypothetical protein